jgi:ParB-like nuclease domain
MISARNIAGADTGYGYPAQKSNSLFDSIRREGVKELLKVRKVEAKNGRQLYTIVDGQARWLCAYSLGIDVPVEIVQMSEDEALAHRNQVKNSEFVAEVFGPSSYPATPILVELAGHFSTRRRMLGLDMSHLDEIAAGVNPSKHAVTVTVGRYAMNAFESMQWWYELTIILAAGRGAARSNHFAFGDGHYMRQAQRANALMSQALCAMGPALNLQPCFIKNGPRVLDPAEAEPGLEFLRCYRRYTRFVMTFMAKVWPGLNLRNVLMP